MLIGKELKKHKDGSATFSLIASDKELGELLSLGIITVKTCHVEFTEKALKDLFALTKTKRFMKALKETHTND